MDESKENSNRSSRIINVILIVCIVSIIAAIYIEYTKVNNLKKEVGTLETLLQNSKIAHDKASNDKNDLTKKVNFFNDMDDEINKAKEEAFKLALDLENKVKNNQTNYKIAYLTFDDGPYYNTYNVLDVLNRYGVQATFFTTSVNGEKCYDNSEANCFLLYNEYLKGGHTIANHTYTHAIFRGLYNSTNSFMNAITNQHNHIKQLTGVTPNITRFPGGSETAKYLKDSIIAKLREAGYGWVDWSSLDGDGGYVANNAQAWNNFLNSTKDNIEVVLLHDYSKVTLAILPDIIEYLRNNNYILLPLFYESSVINK